MGHKYNSLFYRFIQVLQRQRRTMTQTAATRSGEKLAASTMLWVPSCDPPLFLFIVPAADCMFWLLLSHVLVDKTVGKQHLSLSPLFLFLFFFNVYICFFSVSSRPERKLAMGGSIRRRARRCAVPLLSDIPECTTTLHRLGTPPRGQRGQVCWLGLVSVGHPSLNLNLRTFAAVSGSCWTEHMQRWTASVRAWTLTWSLRHCRALCSMAPTPVPQKPIPRTQPRVPTIRPYHPGRHLQKHLWTSARFFWTLNLAAGGTSDHERYPISLWVKVDCLSEDLRILAEPCQD